MNIHAHKKKLAAVLVLGTAAAIGVSLLIPGKPDEEVVREREYTVTRDTITVGVESSGQISAAPYAHSLEAGTQIEELLVKVGSEVKKGDPLASLSTEDLNEQLQAAQDEVSDAEAALLQATSARDVRVAQNNKDKQDGLDGVKQNYDSQIEQLTSEKSGWKLPFPSRNPHWHSSASNRRMRLPRQVNWSKKSRLFRKRSIKMFWKSGA